jgi:hypothetical protein
MDRFRLVIVILLLAPLHSFAQVQLLQEVNEEGDNCADMPKFNGSLHWYGVYKTAIGDSLIKVKVRTKGHSSNYDVFDDRKGRPIFLLGSPKPLKERTVSYSRDLTIEGPPEMLPGQRKNIYSSIKTISHKNGSLELYCLGNVTGMGYCPEIKNYQLRLALRDNYARSQDLTKDLEFKGECGLYTLEWFGDIDADGVPDLLLASSSSSHTRWELFMSSYADPGAFVKKVAAFDFGNCQ